MWDGVKNPGSRRITSSFIGSCVVNENGIEGKKAQWKGLNHSKAWGSSPREISWRKGLFSKWTNPKELLGWNPREHVSIVTKWGITPKIAPSPSWMQSTYFFEGENC
jgi:hypothetical protein